MKIALVGSTSFLGQKILKELKAHQINCILWNRSPKEDDFLFDYPSQKINEHDLMNCQYIIYMAGAGVQAKDVVDKRILYGINASYPLEMISRLRDLNYKGSLVTFGSYFEIGKTNQPLAFVEEDVIHSRCKPLNEYSISKRIFTHFVNHQLQLELPYKVFHFILPNVYGVGENENRILPYLASCVKSGKEINISNGTQIRQFLNARDVARFMTNLSLENEFKSGIYNLGSRAIISVEELVKKVALVAKQHGYEMPDINFGKVKRSDSSAGFLALNDQLSRSYFNWNDAISIEEGIKEYF